MSVEAQRPETPVVPGGTLASQEFFHLLQRIDHTENALRQEIKQTESSLRQKIEQTESSLRQEISALRGDIRTFTWMAFALVLAAIGIAVAVVVG